jgi:two-component system KDP operon response regulator KdpE
MELEIDYGKQEVTLSGQKIHMTPIEYNLIALLSKNAGKVLANDFIIREIWGTTADGLRALRANMANIRRKIEINPAMSKYILAEIGVGYRMIDES